MGWWDDAEGRVWGDEPADVMDRALVQITAQFRAEFGRPPTLAELIAGLTFSSSGEES